MEMRQDMRHELRQKLVMTPKLQQAIKLLQVPALELQQILKQEMMTNPMLEETEDTEDATEDATVESTEEDEGEFKTGEDEIDWDRYLKDGFEMGSRASGEEEEYDGFYEKVPVVRNTLDEYLMSQLRMATDSGQDIKVGEFIIGSLDNNGFLTISAEEIASLLAVDVETVHRIIALIQTLDPPGVGAKDLKESLLIQLAQEGLDDSLAGTIVREHLDDFLQKRYPEIARKLKKTVKDIQAAAHVIRKRLDPRPGTRYSSDEPRYIVPDLIVEKVDEDYFVQLNDRNVPTLRINRTYRDILSRAEAKSKKERDYVVEKLNSARWLIRTIDQRRRTMIKVMKAILEVQRDFFDRGVQHLKPLTLQQIAERVGMHESTVSRVTNNKYVQTPRGVFELKHFFSTGLRTDDGDIASSKKIKARIKELIDRENSMKPLSDQEIAEMLRQDGFIVARRTVAKYRDQLGVFPARMRKQY
jgi:RNA polymerase sigma-54 factor